MLIFSAAAPTQTPSSEPSVSRATSCGKGDSANAATAGKPSTQQQGASVTARYVAAAAAFALVAIVAVLMIGS